jgi:glycosyltransferase involved in cell wall biosynthesis
MPEAVIVGRTETPRVLFVTNMYPTDITPTAGPFVATQVESLRAAGVDVEVMHLPRAALGRRVYRGLRRRVRQIVDGGRYDIVHVSYGGVMADAVTRAVHNRPVVVTFHGTDLLAGPGEGPLSRVSLRLGVMASHRAARRASGVIVVSRNLQDALPRSIVPARIWVVPNGIDLDRFQPLPKGECRRALGWDPSSKHVLFPSSPSRAVKRFALAKASVDLLPEEQRVELHVLEGVAHADVPVWLNSADAILLTSAHEGSPMAVKEALACNVPIVSVDVGDVRERLEGIDGCFVVSPRPEALAEALGLALPRKQPIDARERVAELSLERIADRILTIYRTLDNNATIGVGHG